MIPTAHHPKYFEFKFVDHVNQIHNMYCIIPAAGKGSRFGQGIPKALINVNGQTIISRQIRALAKHYNIRVVVGYKYLDVIKEISQHNFKVDIYVNHNYDTTTVVDSVRLGIDTLNENILVVDGDVLFKDISQFHDENIKIGVKNTTSEQPMYAIVKNRNVIGFSEEQGNYEWSGISVMPSSIYHKPNRYVCDAISQILPSRAILVDSYEIDTLNDLKGAECWITQ